MANSLVQFRTDDATRNEAADICERLGIDLPTYMRMCIARLIQENGIPFSMKLEKKTGNRAVDAMKAASRIAEENGISDMSLEEINAESIIRANNIMVRAGTVAVVPENSMHFALIIAADATGLPIEFFNKLKPRDAIKVKNIVTHFFYGED